MRERHVPRPLPEGNHGQPEGAMEARKPITLLHEHAMRVFDKDPEKHEIRKGVVAFNLQADNKLLLDATTSTSAVDDDIYTIDVILRLSNGDQEHKGRLSLDEEGVLTRNSTLALKGEVIRTLDELESEDGVREIDPITGEEVPSAKRQRIESEVLGRIYDDAAINHDLGLDAITDEEAVAFLQLLKIQMPSQLKGLRLPENPDKGQPQHQTIEAFKAVTEAIANEEVMRVSMWVDFEHGFAAHTMTSTSLISTDGTETPYAFTLERIRQSTSAEGSFMHRTVWDAQRGTFRTGTSDQMLSLPTGETDAPELVSLNKAAKNAYTSHMASSEADASPEELQEVLGFIGRRAAELVQKPVQSEEYEPEISSLYSTTRQIDVVDQDEIEAVHSSEPHVGNSTNSSIADQENDVDKSAPGKDNGIGKSK